MKTFSHVEDYIEVINGDVNPQTGKPYGLFDTTPPIINLARYDVNIISNMSSSSGNGNALTDKQGDLAVKLILKYRRQLSAVGIDITPVDCEHPPFRKPLRVVDRTRAVYIDNGKIILQFPYDTKLIDGIRELAKLSQGRWTFDKTTRKWILSLTETNVVAAGGFAKINGFEISPEFSSIEKTITDCESIPYAIELQKIENQFTVTNADKNLLQYINDNIGGLEYSNLYNLVDNSSILGYSVSSSIEDEIHSSISQRFYNLLVRKQIKFSPDILNEKDNTEYYSDIIEYANAVNRWPIFVYEPDMSDRLYQGMIVTNFEEDEILKVKNHRDEIDITNKKIVYFNKYNYRWMDNIPLLVSSAGMMHGGEKTMLLQRAEKIIYFAADVYTSNGKK
jgi:hypothetical protein